MTNVLSDPHALADLATLKAYIDSPVSLELCQKAAYLGCYLHLRRYLEEKNVLSLPEDYASLFETLQTHVDNWELSLAPMIIQQWTSSWDADSIAVACNLNALVVQDVLETQLYQPNQVTSYSFNNLCQRARFAASILPGISRKLLALQ